MVTFLRSGNPICPSFWTRIQQRNGRRFALATLLFSAFILSGCVAKVSSKSTSDSTGTTGTLTASSQSVTFGAVPVGQTASTSISAINEGSAAVVISQASVSGQS